MDIDIKRKIKTNREIINELIFIFLGMIVLDLLLFLFGGLNEAIDNFKGYLILFIAFLVIYLLIVCIVVTNANIVNKYKNINPAIIDNGYFIIKNNYYQKEKRWNKILLKDIDYVKSSPVFKFDFKKFKLIENNYGNMIVVSNGRSFYVFDVDNLNMTVNKINLYLENLKTKEFDKGGE